MAEKKRTRKPKTVTKAEEKAVEEKVELTSEAGEKIGVAKVVPLYEKRSWKSVRSIFRCLTCGHCVESEDEMKVHVLKHVNTDRREELLDELTKE